MVTLALDAHALARVRFTTSALWEVGLSALVLRRRVPGPVHEPWVRRVRGGVDPVTLERVSALTAGESYVLDLLTPDDDGWAGEDLAHEAGRLRALPADVVHRDLAALARANRSRPGQGHDWVRELAELEPDKAIDRLVAVLDDYWSAALAPTWQAFRRLAEGDIAQHARVAAHRGPGAMLGDLHPRVRFTGEGLDIPGACEASAESADPSGGVLLAPSAFAWPDVHVQPNAPHRPAIAYAVRGLATLWLDDAEVEGSLARLLGAGRARVLVSLRAPSTTGEIAHDLGLAPSTVSDHLAALTGAHLATGRRDGRRVVYDLTDLGRELAEHSGSSHGRA